MSLKILFAASECVPFASTGGLADVASALPRALSRRGTKVERIMPLYRAVHDAGIAIHPSGHVFDIHIGGLGYRAEIWETVSDEPKTWFVNHEEFYDRSQLYALPDREYEDNLTRFVFFQQAVVALIDALGQPYDIVHGNDWQCGLLPLYLEHGLYPKQRVRREKTVFTVHNLAYQGMFPGSNFHLTGLPEQLFSTGMLEYHQQMNFMKAGLVASDALTTVSRRYAEEIRTKAFGFGLEGVIGEQEHKLTGILNGVDYTAWDPSGDEHLACPYDADSLEGKAACKEALLERMGLDPAVNGPLIGMVSRMADQKGFDLFEEAMPKLMASGARMIMLGSGERAYQDMARAWQERWPELFAVHVGFEPALAHQVEAGADIFLMPSKFEPCGLNQMYSLRYGTVPVVHATGGLDDTITEVSGKSGTGFKMKNYSARDLVRAVEKAVKLYVEKPDTWRTVQQRGMKKDYSWAASARAYLQLYRNVLKHD